MQVVVQSLGLEKEKANKLPLRNLYPRRSLYNPQDWKRKSQTDHTQEIHIRAVRCSTPGLERKSNRLPQEIHATQVFVQPSGLEKKSRTYHPQEISYHAGHGSTLRDGKGEGKITPRKLISAQVFVQPSGL